jgi:hypothetical protein
VVPVSSGDISFVRNEQFAHVEVTDVTTRVQWSPLPVEYNRLDGTIASGCIKINSKNEQRQGDIPVYTQIPVPSVTCSVHFRSTQNQKFTDLTMTCPTRAVEWSLPTRGAKGN